MADIKLKNREGTEKGYTGVLTVSIPNASGVGTSEFTILDEILTTGADAHNSIYRGSYLGSGLSEDQISMITSGTFDELYVGDYWTINSVNWRIGGFDYFYGFGDTACSTHHVVIIPDSVIASSQMNTTKTTGGGYIGSYGRSYCTSTILTAAVNAFGSAHILSHRSLLCNSSEYGSASGNIWVDSSIEIPSEVQVFGTTAFGNSYKQETNQYDGYNIGSDNSQLPIFKHSHSSIPAVQNTTRQSYWLRDIASEDSFCYVGLLGDCSSAPATASIGIRPIFAIY